MATGTPVRDWATVDYYALLGIQRDADPDEVTRAFRTLAKESHPDAAADKATAERFHDISAAYAVLGDPRTRREYDRVRAEVRGPADARVVPAPVRVPVSRRVPKPWSRRRSLLALVAGALVLLLGIGVSVLTWSLHAQATNLRSHTIPVTATRFDVNDEPYVHFKTRAGEVIQVPEPQQHGDPSGLGPTVTVRYDPSDPEHVITGASTAARDITFAIVALKFMIGGAVFMVFGFRRLRAADAF